MVHPLDVWLQSRVVGRKASQVDLRLGSECLVLTHHLVQEFGTGEVHRSFAILSLHQAGELSQLLLHARFEVPFLTKFHERVMKPWIFLQLFQGPTFEQSRQSALPSERHNPRRSAIPQGRHVHPRRHGMALLYPYQSSPDLG